MIIHDAETHGRTTGLACGTDSQANPSNTRVEPPSVDVNRVLAEHYRTSEPLTFTCTMLWDMEVRKAWRPDRYIPSVVQEGSAGTWSRRSVAGGAESFLRSSQQRLWLEPTEYGLVAIPKPFVESCV